MSDFPLLVEGHGEDGARRARTGRTVRRIASAVGEGRRAHKEYDCGEYGCRVQRIQPEDERIYGA